jgi:hypothetical protein
MAAAFATVSLLADLFTVVTVVEPTRGDDPSMVSSAMISMPGWKFQASLAPVSVMTLPEMDARCPSRPLPSPNMKVSMLLPWRAIVVFMPICRTSTSCSEPCDRLMAGLPSA